MSVDTASDPPQRPPVRREELNAVFAVATVALVIALVVLLRACTSPDSLGAELSANESQSGDSAQTPEGVVCLPGATGANGEPGLAGELGETGVAGRDGVDGVDGDDGDDGSDGASGTIGLPGVSGVDGQTGLIGESGVMGPQGEPGPQGDPGPQGVQGEPGSCEGGEGLQLGDPCPLFHPQGDLVGVISWASEGNHSVLRCVAFEG